MKFKLDAKPMYMLRLFHQSEPFHQIQARELFEGELSVGRDDSAGWPIADPTRTLSRRHCSFAVEDGHLTLRDASANGVFVGAERRRLPQNKATPVEPGETIRLGEYIIVVEDPDAAQALPESRALLGAIEPEAGEIPVNWASAPAEKPVVADGSLLEAFCAGARLDASAFSGEDPTQVMRRLGAAYQQMVLGLGSLMNERTLAKTEYHLERTTVRAEGNNPFRWAPAERVAVDLLRPREDGFLSGSAAVQASFNDLRGHLMCTAAGARAAVIATMEALDPTPIEDELRSQAFMLKNRAAAAWSRYVETYDDLYVQARDNPESPANRAFREAYERQHQALAAKGSAA